MPSVTYPSPRGSPTDFAEEAEMKGELGLDHFEGRSYVGWHHHVSVAICRYAFVVTERMRQFLPSTRRHVSDA